MFHWSTNPLEFDFEANFPKWYFQRPIGKNFIAIILKTCVKQVSNNEARLINENKKTI